MEVSPVAWVFSSPSLNTAINYHANPIFFPRKAPSPFFASFENVVDFLPFPFFPWSASVLLFIEFISFFLILLPEVCFSSILTQMVPSAFTSNLRRHNEHYRFSCCWLRWLLDALEKAVTNKKVVVEGVTAHARVKVEKKEDQQK